MANPAIINCPVGEWTLVATDVTTGVVHILTTSPSRYLHTYRDTADPAPTTQPEGVSFDTPLTISASAGIDVYIWCLIKSGSVRVDL